MNIFEHIYNIISKKAVIFADLDGTLIKTKSGKEFAENIDDWEFNEDAIVAIENYSPKYLHIVTNQGGIDLGFLTEKDFLKKINCIVKLLRKRLPLTKVTYAYCKSNDVNDRRRKPNPGMLEEYAIDFYSGTDCTPMECLMIGDASGLDGQFSDSDVKCAKAFGCKYLDVDDFIKKYKN